MSNQLGLNEIGIIHSNKSQNFRFRTIEQFEDKSKRVLITTDIMSRGLDLNSISHVVSFDTPNYPENYVHRIGRTARAGKWNRPTFTSVIEKESKANIEKLMGFSIPIEKLPKSVKISSELIEEEKPITKQRYNPGSRIKKIGEAYHEKSEKNQNQFW